MQTGKETELIDLFTWRTPNGRKVAILLEETGLPYTVHVIDIREHEPDDPALLKISPNNRIPAIIDHETGISMMESGAILLYLAEKTGQFLPKDTKGRWQTVEWLMWQMAGVGPMFGQAHHFYWNNKDVSPYAEERYLTEVRRLYEVLDERLGKATYMAGDYSIADMSTWPWVARYEWHAIDLNDFPNVKRWYLDIAARPAVQRGYNCVPGQEQEIPLP